MPPDKKHVDHFKAMSTDEVCTHLADDNNLWQRLARAELARRDERRRDRETNAAERTARATRKTALVMMASVLVAVLVAALSAWQLFEIRKQRLATAHSIGQAEGTLEDLAELEQRLTDLGEGLVKIAYLSSPPVNPGDGEGREEIGEVATIADRTARILYPDDNERLALLAEIESMKERIRGDQTSPPE